VRGRFSAGRAALIALCALVFLFLVAPLVVVIPVSFSSATYLVFPPPGFSLQYYQNYFGSGTWLGPTGLSIEIAVVVSLASCVFGVPAAFALVRGRFPGRGLINALSLSPLIVPEVAAAIAIYYAFAAFHLVGSRLGLMIAQTALGVPFVVINVSASLYGVDRRLEQAAQILGASPLRSFWKVTFPLIRPGILAGALFAFIASWDDLLIPLFMASATSVTLPLRMWQGLREAIDPTISAVSTLLIATTTCLLIAAEVLRRRQERIRTRPVDVAETALVGGTAAVK
jgi:putative spermidine/putrescine transport system permease protein